MSVKVIAISGHAGHGKDTVANIIEDYLKQDGKTVLITHYADLLKYICQTFFGWNGRKDEKGRSLLQYVGTDVIRKSEPNFWVDFVADIIKYFEEQWDYVLIPDTRFPNEFDRLKEKGLDAVHVRVIRKNYQSLLTNEQKKHPSETALDDTVPDFLFENSGSIDEKKKKIKTWITEELYEQRR